MSEKLHRCGDPALQARERWIASIPPGYAVPLEMQQRAMFPWLCEDFPDETPETLGWLGCACFQLEEPEWMEPAAFGGDPGCERLPGLPHGLTRYEDGWRCYRCGAQPFWPLHECEPWPGPDDAVWPYPCTGWEVLPTATYDGQATLGLCWVKP